jgi:Asp-tRNA(Asn)/Glu-tRNA(Gln) amidotransferase A subunit family amidase
MHPRETRNPHNTEHTPGGSSSGSAAAVAAGMVPLAIGTQTNGSVIRPASFCGVVGFKPTYGLIPRTGVLTQSRDLDTIGVFARTVGDAALLVDALAGHDPGDSDSRRERPPLLLDGIPVSPDRRPVLAFVRSPVWSQADASTHAALEALASSLGNACKVVALPDIFGAAVQAHRTLNFAGMAYNYRPYYERGRAELRSFMHGAIEEGRVKPALAFLGARETQAVLRGELDRLFAGYDAILTAAAPGEAPRGLDATGNPVFSTIWSLCGVPAISLPLLRGPSGLPLGVQLVGRAGEDAKLLATAQWLTTRAPAFT